MSLLHGPLPFVARHGALMALLVRFAPGLRVAIALACACIDMSPLRSSILNSITAVIWAAVLLGLVAHAGPAALEHVGLGGWQAAPVVGVFVVALFKSCSAASNAGR